MLKKIFVLINMLFVAIILISFSNVRLFAHEGESNFKKQIEESMISDIAKNGEFSGNRILVVLNKQATSYFKDYSVSDFPEIDISSVEMLTEKSSLSLKKQLLFENEIEDDEMKINSEEFRTILCLTLRNSSKENVLHIHMMKTVI